MKAIDLTSRATLAPGVRLQTDRVTGEPVLLSPEGIHVLNETACAIVVHCDGTRTVAEVTAALAGEYDAPVEALREDVLACLAELHETGRIVIA